MAETTRDKLAREMTHWAPVESGPRVPDWLADLVRGASYLPYRLAGTPTDLGLLFTNAAGLTDPNQRYAGSSDWIIDMAARHGLAAPRRGTTGELIGDIGGQIAMPGVSPAEMGAYAKALPFLLGTFGGMGAKTADMDALARALQMEDAGEAREAIRQATGWFRAPWDKKWRFEIDDSGSSIISGRLPTRRIPGYGEVESWKVGDAFSHDKLFDAYPEMRNYNASFTEAPVGGEFSGLGGGWVSYGKRATAQPFPSAEQVAAYEKAKAEWLKFENDPRIVKYSKELDSVIDDEAAFMKVYDEAIENEGAALASRMNRAAENMNLYPKGGRGLNQNARSITLHELTHGVARNEGFTPGTNAKMAGGEMNYLRDAGEAEARLVQARRDLSPEMRGLLDPVEQMDTMLKQEGILGGLDDLVVRYGDGPAMSAPKMTRKLADEMAGKDPRLDEIRAAMRALDAREQALWDRYAAPEPGRQGLLSGARWDAVEAQERARQAVMGSEDYADILGSRNALSKRMAKERKRLAEELYLSNAD